MIENFENLLNRKDRQRKPPDQKSAHVQPDEEFSGDQEDEVLYDDTVNGDSSEKTDDRDYQDSAADGDFPDGEGFPDDTEDEEFPDDVSASDEDDELFEEDPLFPPGRFRPGGLSLQALSALIIAVAVLSAALFAILINRNWFYNRYEVVFTRAQEDAVSYSYCNFDGSILRYGTDGATLYDQEGETIWDVAYAMEEPAVVSRGSVMAIYDAGGTGVVICDKSGQIGAVTTRHPVLRADIARQGTVATIQEDRQNVWIEYYSKEGDTIAEIKTSIEDPGYPMDLAVSPDGMLLSVAYTGFSDGMQTGTIRFYNFGSYGQNQMDNRVAAFDYADRVIPEIGSLGENGFVAFRDNGFSLYSGGGIPEQRADVSLDGRIQAVFYDENHIGLLTEDPEDGLVHLKIFDIRGHEVTDRVIAANYQKIELFGDEVNFYNGAGLHVYTVAGTEKFSGEYGEPAQAFFAVGKYRYVAVTDNSIDLIRLK